MDDEATRRPQSDGALMLNKVMAAEQEAEDALAGAKKVRDKIIEDARSMAQSVERRTDKRIDACRTEFGRRTGALVAEIEQEESERPGDNSAHDRRNAIRRASETTARRLIGLA